mmetsp:Transcript_27474/g.48569  ORF Transcript_27474/g.48569 Transcript_27474/m.48569 type:complete len:239 (+) Transcript_27474:941-1657(+)
MLRGSKVGLDSIQRLRAVMLLGQHDPSTTSSGDLLPTSVVRRNSCRSYMSLVGSFEGLWACLASPSSTGVSQDGDGGALTWRIKSNTSHTRWLSSNISSCVREFCTRLRSGMPPLLFRSITFIDSTSMMASASPCFARHLSRKLDIQSSSSELICAITSDAGTPHLTMLSRQSRVESRLYVSLKSRSCRSRIVLMMDPKILLALASVWALGVLFFTLHWKFLSRELKKLSSGLRLCAL